MPDGSYTPGAARLEVKTLTRQARFVARQMPMDEEDDRRREVVFSTEAEVERFFGIEVLSHEAGAVNLDFLNSGRAPLLFSHDTNRQIGVVEEASVEGGQGKAVVRFGESELARQELQDVDDGIRQNASVGYDINEVVRTETGDVELFEVTRWTPLEISIVSIPADQSAGFGRTKILEIGERQTMPQEQIEKTPAPQPSPEPSSEKVVVREVQRDVPRELTQEEKDKAVLDARTAETARVSELVALGQRHNLKELADELIEKGTPIEAARGQFLDRIGDATPLHPPEGELGMSTSDLRAFSLLGLIRAQMNIRQDPANAEKYREPVQVAYEASAEIAKRMGDPEGIYIPWDWQVQAIPPHELRMMAQRAPLAVGTGTGGSLVGTDHLGASFIEILRNRIKVRQLGARIMTGLRGNIQIPRQNGAGVGGWVAEDAETPEAVQTFDQVTMSPKTVGCWTEMTRQLLLQSDPSVDLVVRDDLIWAIALATDYAAINGSGTSDQPRGILNTTGIGLVEIGTNGGPMAWPQVIDLETVVADKNADLGSLAYLGSARVRGHMKQRPKVDNQPIYLWETDTLTPTGPRGIVNGYLAEVSNQVPNDLTKGTLNTASALIYANWADLLLGEWGALDLLVNPYSEDKRGRVRISVMRSSDVAVRHPESFGACKDIDAPLT